jgi:putative ABC transport system permease protein
VKLANDLARDLLSGVRAALRNPRSTALAVLVLGLGIGTSTALFSVLDGVVLRGLPFRDGDRIVSVSTGEGRDWPMPITDLTALRERRQPFDEIAGFLSLNSVLSHPQRGTRSFTTSYVTGNLFPMLGAEPLFGRTVRLEDEDPAAPSIVVLSHAVWRSHFAGDPDVVGETVLLNRESATIVGVMPEAFQFPIRQEAWSAYRGSVHPWSTRTLFAVARLPEGRTAAGAEIALASLLPALDEILSQEKPRRAWVTPYTEAVLPVEIQRALRLMLWAGIGLLIVACANTSNLRLAQGLAREHERSVRSALGASRLDLLRLQIAEALALATAGAIVGLGLAWLLTRLASQHLLHGSMLVRQFWIDVRLDARSLAFAGAALVLALLCGGLLPALWSGRSTKPVPAPRATVPRLALGAQRTVVALEVAVSLALLVGTALLVQSAISLLAPPLGFDPTALSRTLVNTYQARLDEPAAQEAFWARTLAGLRARPEIDGAVLVSRPPWTGWVGSDAGARVRVAGAAGVATIDLPEVALHYIAPGTLETLRLPLRQGRALDQSDVPAVSYDGATLDDRAAERPIVVSESFARRHLVAPPLGQALELWPPGRERPVKARIVGVAADLGLDRPGSPRAEERLYLPAHLAGGFLLVRARHPGAEVLRVIDEELARGNPLVATLDHRTLEQDRAEQTWVERRLAQLFVLFGGVAVLLGGVGLYGVLDLVARQRERELGIRAALGAVPRQLFALVMHESGRMIAFGLAIGAGLSVWLVRQLDGLVHGGASSRQAAAGVAIAVVLLAATLASLRPAQRASAVDPAETLRR